MNHLTKHFGIVETQEIVDAIDNGDRKAALDRVNHWSRVGLLEAAGDQNPGTGRKRHFPISMIKRAQTLNRLANLGLGVAQMWQFVRAPKILSAQLREIADLIDSLPTA